MQETDLPIKRVLGEIDAALQAALSSQPPRSSRLARPPSQPPRAVLVAPPGAGKSTFLPLHLLKAPWARSGRIILLEPRRLAARAIARRMAQLLGEEVGQTIGYLMRMDKNYSAKTRILVMTEGSFTRMILDNPELEGICAVLFDEFHERSLEADFSLALALDVADSLRPDLRLLVMSATMDGARVAGLLGQGGRKAPVIESHGRNFPVEILYRPRGQGIRGADSRSERVEAAVAEACYVMLAAGGAILAFLPGQEEIRRTQALLEDMLKADERDAVMIAPLYGGLPAEEQEKALRPTAKGIHKIVLATSIAESALTIEDVRIVIDSGLARLPVFEPASGIMRLQTRRVSRASATQRAGRAGRVQAGIAVRLWHEGQNSALPAFTPPEILAADMRNMLLDCADFGINTMQDLRFLDRPPAAACAEARKNLQALGALDETGRITVLGRALRQVNLPVDQAHMLLNAALQGRKQAEQAALLAVLLLETGLGGAGNDLDRSLDNFARDKSARAAKARSLAKNLAEKAIDLAAKLPGRRETENRQAASGKSGLNRGNNAGAGALLAGTWWERVARLRQENNAANSDRANYILANGRGAFLDKSSPLFGKPWLVCAELSGQAANARIKAAAELDEAWPEQHLADKITNAVYTVFDGASRGLRSFRQRRLGAILLETMPLPPPKGEEANSGWLRAVREYGLEILPWDKAAEALRARLAFLHAKLGTPWPDVSDKALSDRLEDWLLPFLRGQARFAAEDNALLAQALYSLPGHMLQRQIDRLAPAYFTVPSGSNIAIRYEGGAAALAVRVQELFGLRQHPALAGGKVPLLLELLSPAGRILQITADIAGFWAGSWKDVAADMRGRYPKHFWPQNPEAVVPTARAKSRKPQTGGNP